MNHQAESDGARRAGLWMIAAAWLIALVLVALAANEWLTERANPNRHPTTVATAGGRAAVVLRPNQRHQYRVTGQLAGMPVEFLVDTGATDVSVPAALAQRLGLTRGLAGQAVTANGTVGINATVIPSVTIGPIHLVDVPGSINPGMRDDIVLLGMSALSRLEMHQRGDALVLQQPRR